MQPDRFNGAMTFQPWKFRRAWWAGDTGPSFNGATTFQPWKCLTGGGNLETKEELQWGHDFSAVEITLLGIEDDLRRCASMGPRLFSRGNIIFATYKHAEQTELQWGHDFSAVEMYRELPVIQ